MSSTPTTTLQRCLARRHKSFKTNATVNPTMVRSRTEISIPTQDEIIQAMSSAKVNLDVAIKEEATLRTLIDTNRATLQNHNEHWYWETVITKFRHRIEHCKAAAILRRKLHKKLLTSELEIFHALNLIFSSIDTEEPIKLQNAFGQPAITLYPFAPQVSDQSPIPLLNPSDYFEIFCQSIGPSLDINNKSVYLSRKHFSTFLVYPQLVKLEPPTEKGKHKCTTCGVDIATIGQYYYCRPCHKHRVCSYRCGQVLHRCKIRKPRGFCPCGQDAIYTCTRCKNKFYCGPTCQSSDWNNHANECINSNS